LIFLCDLSDLIPRFGRYSRPIRYPLQTIVHVQVSWLRQRFILTKPGSSLLRSGCLAAIV
jgi:hypothetical protein